MSYRSWISVAGEPYKYKLPILATKHRHQNRFSVVLPTRSTATLISMSRTSGIEIVSGREKILALSSILYGISERAGDSHDAEDLAFFLDGPSDFRKIPHLLLFASETCQPATTNYIAAVLLFEYRLPLGWNRFGNGIGVLSSLDQTGRRTVFAPRSERTRVAVEAAQHLMQTGRAKIVYLVFNRAIEDLSCTNQVRSALSRADGHQVISWKLAEKAIPTYLPLLATLDLTLARIGQRTRQNYRYARRRAERDLGSVFVSNVRIELAEFLDLSSKCMFAVSKEHAIKRYHALSASKISFFAGIHDRNGHWLGLVAGRRRTNEIEIDWQMNHGGFASYSLSTVLRSCLIEDEIAKGTTRLYIEGGTSQHIGTHFVFETMTELLLKKQSWYTWLISQCMGLLLPAQNPIATLMRNYVFTWKINH